MWKSFGDKREIVPVHESPDKKRFKTDRISALVVLLWFIATSNRMTDTLNIAAESRNMYIAYVSAAMAAIFCTLGLVKYVKNDKEIDFQIITFIITYLAIILITVFYR